MNKEKIIDLFMDYTRIYSPSYKEDDFAQVLVKELKNLGLDVTIDPSNDKTGSNTGNIIAVLKGDPSIEPILFSAHMDTVGPCEDIEPIIEDGIIKSKGDTILSADDKSGIVAILKGIEYIIDNKIKHGDIEVVFSVCEEVGLLGAKHMDYSKIRSKRAFVMDSGGDVGGVIVQGPSQAIIKAEIKGLAAHAGLNPERGVSAIQIGARAINNMELLRIDEETTANVGTFKGGSATNIVADKARIDLEVRSLCQDKLDKQVDQIITCLKEAGDFYKGQVDIDLSIEYPSFNVDLSEDLVKLSEKSIKDLGLEFRPSSTGGGSDTNILNSKGIKALTLATGMENAHSVNESISIENLVNATRLVAKIIENTGK